MGGHRFKKEERKLNLKKVFIVLILPILIPVIIYGSKLYLKNVHQYSIKRTEVPGYFSVLGENGKWGVISNKGEKIIDTKYEEMVVVPKKDTPLFIITEVEDYKKGKFKTKVLNENGNEIFKTYTNVRPIEYNSKDVVYDQELLIFEKNGKYGLVDYKGNLKMEAKYDSIETIKGISGKVKVKENGKYGILNTKTNTFIVPALYKSVLNITKDNDTGYDVVFDKKHGVISSSAVKVLPTEYDEILKVNSKNYYVAKKNGKTKIYNKEGKEKSNYVNGTTLIEDDVIIYKNKKYGVKTIEGADLIEAKYENIKKTTSSTYIVKEKSKENIISTDGEKTKRLEKDYDSIRYDEKTNIYIAKNNDNNVEDIYVQEKDGSFKLKKQFEILEINEAGYIKVLENKETKLYNFKLEEVQEKDVIPSNNLFKFKENGKYGFKNSRGEVIVPPIYDDAQYQNVYGYVAVNRNGKWGVLDYTGKVIVEPKYTFKDYLLVDFIGKYHRMKDVNLFAYTDKI